MVDERFVGTDQEVGGEVEVVGDGAVDGAAAAGWFDDLDVSPAIPGPRVRAAWATGQSLPSGRPPAWCTLDAPSAGTGVRRTHAVYSMSPASLPAEASISRCTLRNSFPILFCNFRIILDINELHILGCFSIRFMVT